MNEASVWRLQLAQRIAPTYAQHPRVAATGIAGSVSRGHADCYSDIEIFVYWTESTTDEELITLAHEAGATGRRDFGWNDEYNEWAEEYLVLGVKIDVTHYLVSAVEAILDDVLLRFDTSDFKCDHLAQLSSLIPISGHALLHQWQKRAAHYPDGLALAIVRHYLAFGPRSWVELLAARDDVLALTNINVMALRNILAVLEGLNHIYHRPGDKWIDRTIDQMRIKPNDFSVRMKALLRSEPMDAVRLLHELIEDTIALVESHMSEVDTAPVRARIEHFRPVWDEAPKNLQES